MAVKVIKDRGASVLARLKKQAKESGINYQTCLQLFVQEEFLRRLEASSYAENLILKGGMLLYVISNYESRPTMDIDFMIRRLPSDVEKMRAVVYEICKADTHNDFVRIEVVSAEKIATEKKYPGVRIGMMAYIKNVRIPFSIDVGVDDVIVPGAIKRTVATRLDGFKKPNVYTYSLESTLAEKFDAILKRMTAASRMKDFYDIYYWSQMFSFDGRVMQEAVFQTLQHRGTSYEKDSIEQIKAFVQNEFLLTLWRNYNPGVGLEKPDFISVLEQIVRFIGPIFDAILNENEFFGVWLPEENGWK